MIPTIWKLDNSIKNYDWGTKDALSTLFNIQNLNNEYQAELWVGAHPLGVSIAIDSNGNRTKLDELIAQNPTAMLGNQTYQKYRTLPYLFKVLSADKPLSIQVHPDREHAAIGYQKENTLGIALDSANRNYKDPNHKPELIYAITPFWAMNGFRPIDEIITLFTQLDIKPIQPFVDTLKQNPSNLGLQNFFSTLLRLDFDEKKQALSSLMVNIEKWNEPPFIIVKEIAKAYPDDIGLFAPFILNVIQLQPGQAMFLNARTPHAYLKGTGFEVMASSDNVLRAGLTAKNIDIDALLDNTDFHSIPNHQLLTTPILSDHKAVFPVPVNDFAFEMIHSDSLSRVEPIISAEIIFCMEGEITISTNSDSYTLKSGESVFIAYDAGSFHYQGEGYFARIFNR